MSGRCVREDELLDALGRGFVNGELTDHVATCAGCTELRSVAGALLDERVEAIKEAAVPNSSAMWWKMQMRHRQEVQAASRRSLFIGQAATLVIAIALAYALFGTDVTANVKNLVASIHISTPILLILASWAVFAPIAGYIAIKQK